MKDWNEIVENILHTSNALDGKTVNQKFMKLIEEIGELSQAMLIEQDAAGTKHRIKEEYSVPEELADCIICLFSLWEIIGIPFDVLKSHLETKMLKWSKKLENERRVFQS